MCLITNQLEPKIAEKDMIVYKRLDIVGDFIESPYKRFEYELNKLYETVIQYSNYISTFDEKDKMCLPYDWEDQVHKGSYKCIGQGFHATFTKERLFTSYPEIHGNTLFECVIPAGSEYYTEPSGTIVSNKIIVKKVVEE